ncbi:MAG: hypothetical protein IKO22_07265 [Oscillospiraceae bacterium]|nr:hypothetical protein [Oscillospiraceae bacterium]
MNTNESNSRKKKKASPGIAVFFIIMLVASLMEELPRGSGMAALIPLIAAVVIIASIFTVVRTAAKKAAAGKSTAPRPAMNPAVRSAAHPVSRTPARANLSGPDAYCLVCDQTGVDHFERDRQRRLRQLDYWLSIGLIERKEYNLLREKYSRDVPHQTIR